MKPASESSFAVAAVLVASACITLGCESQDEYRMGVARRVFDRQCAGCHGSVGGDGPTFVGATGATAPDLWRLSERLGSPLPRDRLAGFIDGRREVDAHGPRDMPVWGEQLYDNLPDSDAVEEMRGGTIELLLDYIERNQSS